MTCAPPLELPEPDDTPPELELDGATPELVLATPELVLKDELVVPPLLWGIKRPEPPQPANPRKLIITSAAVNAGERNAFRSPDIRSLATDTSGRE